MRVYKEMGLAVLSKEKNSLSRINNQREATMAPAASPTSSFTSEIADKMEGRDFLIMVLVVSILFYITKLLLPFAQSWANAGAEWWIFKKKQGLEKEVM